jgi:hypothetical protein
MSDSAQAAADLAGLALAGTVIAVSWPAARKYFARWTGLQRLKFVGSILLYVAFGISPIVPLNLLVPRDAAGQALPGTAAAAMLATLGWISLGLLLLLRYLMDEPQPKWIKHFGIAHGLCLVIVAVGVGIILAVRYG